jgi:hypothetical protein
MPSWASMIERQIDRPIPIPPDFVVKGGFKISSRPTRSHTPTAALADPTVKLKTLLRAH